MLPHQAYQKQRDAEPSRIDLILKLFDRAFKYLDQAEAELRVGNKIAAGTAQSRVQVIATALASGHSGKNELSANLIRLYEFVCFKMTESTVQAMQDARKILKELNEGFEAARPEAIRLEREGQIPPIDRQRAVYVKA